MLVLLQSDMEEYGIDWDGPAMENNSDNSEGIPEITCPLLPNEFEVQEFFDPLSECDDLCVVFFVFFCMLLHMH